MPAEHWDDWGHDDVDDSEESDWGDIAFCKDKTQRSLGSFARHTH